MALSKSTRIMILLGIDSAFFLLELVVGEKHALSKGSAS
jgi:zinc transporter 1